MPPPPTYEEATRQLTRLEKIHKGLFLASEYVDFGDLPNLCLVSNAVFRIFIRVLWANPTKFLMESRRRGPENIFNRLMDLRDVSQQIRSLTNTIDLRALLPELEYHQAMPPESHISRFKGKQRTLMARNWVHYISIVLPNVTTLIVDGVKQFSTFTTSEANWPELGDFADDIRNWRKEKGLPVRAKSFGPLPPLGSHFLRPLDVQNSTESLSTSVASGSNQSPSLRTFNETVSIAVTPEPDKASNIQEFNEEASVAAAPKSSPSVDGHTSNLRTLMRCTFVNYAGVLKTFSLFILSAVGCSQLHGFDIFKQHYAKTLIYLDISSTRRPAKLLTTGEWLPYIQNMTNLRVLKLRNNYLKDEDLDVIIAGLGKRLYSLDLRDNLLTKTSVRELRWCVEMPPISTASAVVTSINDNFGTYQRYMAEAPRYRTTEENSDDNHHRLLPGSLYGKTLRPDGLAEVSDFFERYLNLYERSNRHELHLLGTQFMDITGLTHLYISGNKIQLSEIMTILKLGHSMKVLDFGRGNFDTEEYLANRFSNVKLCIQNAFVRSLKENDNLGRQLEILRVHHSAVTHVPTLATVGDTYINPWKLLRTAEDSYSQDAMKFSPAKLEPDLRPSIHTLTLTSLPRYSTGLIIERLKELLQLAAQQEHAIKAVTQKSHRAPRMVTGLRVLRLEFLPKPFTSATDPAEDKSMYSSVTGDTDADTFQSESVNDFSFFSNENTEPPPSPVRANKNKQKPASSEGFLDVLEELRKFRAQNDRKGSTGSGKWTDVLVWSGALEVVTL